MYQKTKTTFIVIILFFIMLACSFSNNENTSPTEIIYITATPIPITSTPTQIIPKINPLTNQNVSDPSLLDLPALLISISHFPVTARPQAGLSFAPWIFEIYITEGATRFLSVFYGEFPKPEPVINGNCQIRNQPFLQTANIIGNRVWLDENQNHMQDDFENGISGVCVNLFDANGNFLQTTSTDSNGYYAFNVDVGNYILQFEKPTGMEFVQKNVGDKSKDSDADQLSGQTEALELTSSLLDLDVGLALSPDFVSSSQLPLPKIGPIRSGRLIYADIHAFFKDSCLIYAFASPEVLDELPQCFFVHHDIDGGGYMLDIDQLPRLAEKNKTGDIDYTSNVFDSNPPSGGLPANQLHVYIAYLNQSAWKYDSASQSYWRYVDDANYDTAGVLHPEIDRLTNRQLQFENVIVLFTKHGVVSPTNLDIHLEENLTGDALLFRDGFVYDIKWTTRLDSDEIKNAQQKPIQFITDDESSLFPLKPGRTWIIVVTPKTSVTEESAGNWYLDFVQPEGAK
ncbi:MAG: CnaB domain-containing protein [Chloroflexi bacterium OLB14]|nr:MAG: CnaB domain-containing protein [Chloroflexi bacterium OLB14]